MERKFQHVAFSGFLKFQTDLGNIEKAGPRP